MINKVINFLIRLLRAFCTEGPKPQIALGVSPVDAPEWDSDDRGALLAFLRTPTGRTLLLWLRHSEEVLKSTACDAAQTRVDHARGRATGYREAIASLILLSAGSQTPPFGGPLVGGPSSAEGDDNTFAAEPVRGAAQLRNQLSHES